MMDFEVDRNLQQTCEHYNAINTEIVFTKLGKDSVFSTPRSSLGE